MEPAVKLALVACGLFFLTGLLTGIWKYVWIARTPDARAPVYVDICHRTALMYSFACLVLAKFAELSAWPAFVDFWATLLPILFFAGAVLSYGIHGWLRDTDNQMQRPHRLGSTHVPDSLVAGAMWALVAAEVGGFGVLLVGALKTLFAAG